VPADVGAARDAGTEISTARCTAKPAYSASVSIAEPIECAITACSARADWEIDDGCPERRTLAVHCQHGVTGFEQW